MPVSIDSRVMKLMDEYKNQTAYLLMGFVILLFPYINSFYLTLGFFVAGLFFLKISPKYSFFRESDYGPGLNIQFFHLFITTAILLLISLLIRPDRFPLFIIGGAFAISTFGNGAADIILKSESHGNIPKSSITPYSAKPSIVFLIAGSIVASFAGVWIWFISETSLYRVTFSMIFFLAVLGAITGALLRSIISRQENIIIPLGSAMTMWLFYAFGFSYRVDTLNLIEILVFAFTLGYLAYKVRIADISAMLSATLLGVVIIIASNISWFFMLLTFFLLGGLFTRYKYSYKRSLGIAEGKGGVRGYKNVFSNSLAALSLAVGYGIFPAYDQLILSAYLGSVATATGDTLASEIGQTYKGKPRMITTFKKAPVGTDGAISNLGEGAAFLGSLVIAILTFIFIQQDLTLAFVIVAGGFIGTNIDSVLGATLQQKGYLTNNGVNLFATISGAIITGFLYYLMGS